MASVAIDDVTRLTFLEVLPDQQPVVMLGFLLRAAACFNSRAIISRSVLSNNGSVYAFNPSRKAGLGEPEQPSKAIRAPIQSGRLGDAFGDFGNHSSGSDLTAGYRSAGYLGAAQ